MPKIFMSYRRADSADSAGRIYDRLVERYARPNIFKDVDSIPPGVNFADYIADSIKQSDTALIVIGPNWLDASAGWNRRRLDDPGDFVRLEIETALRLGCVVIPVLVGGATMPSGRRLPESLHPLLGQNAVEVRRDPDFARDMQRLFEAIDYWQTQPRRELPTQRMPAVAPTGKSHPIDRGAGVPLAAAPAVARTTVATATPPMGAQMKRFDSKLVLAQRITVLAAMTVMILSFITIVAVYGQSLLHGAAKANVSTNRTPTATSTPNYSATFQAVSNHVTAISLGYTSPNPGCDQWHWTPPIDASAICAGTGMTLKGSSSGYSTVTALVDDADTDTYTIKMTISAFVGGGAITLYGTNDNILISLNQTQHGLEWTTSYAGVSPPTGVQTGVTPTASQYTLVIQTIPTSQGTYMSLSVNGQQVVKPEPFDFSTSGAWYEYRLGKLKEIELSRFGASSVTFSNFSVQGS